MDCSVTTAIESYLSVDESDSMSLLQLSTGDLYLYSDKEPFPISYGALEQSLPGAIALTWGEDYPNTTMFQRNVLSNTYPVRVSLNKTHPIVYIN